MILKCKLASGTNEVSSQTSFQQSLDMVFFPVRKYPVRKVGFLPETLGTSLHLSLPVGSAYFFWCQPCIVNGDCHVIKSLLITGVCFYAEISITSLLQDPQINKDVPSRITKKLGLNRAPELIRNDFSFSLYFQYIFNCFSIFSGLYNLFFFFVNRR